MRGNLMLNRGEQNRNLEACQKLTLLCRNYELQGVVG
jgi:hypothetical protein